MKQITTEQELGKTIEYIAKQTKELCIKIIDQKYPIGYLTVFSHSQDEFKNLRKIAEALGEIVDANNGYAVVLNKPIDKIPKIRIRKPDPERPQVGCADFVISDYNAFKRQYLGKHPNNLRLIVRPEYEMIEFLHPDCDVLAYVVSK